MKPENSTSTNPVCICQKKQRHPKRDARLGTFDARSRSSARWSYCVMLAVLLLAAAGLSAQSTTTGAVFGTVTDATGAVVPGATATLKSPETGRTSTATTDGAGEYRFSLLQPGRYSVTVSRSGFTTTTVRVEVGVGQVNTSNVKLEVGAQSQTVEVSGAAPVLQADNGNISTTISETMIANQPNPGNDLTYLAQTAPGAVMNTQNGYGNFSTFGLPGTSNLFTTNGMNDNDPFLNLNNTGATNQMLGTNDARELTVVNNGYSVQYGGLAGSNVNIVTKSGTNQFHGNAEYFFNWDGLNSNNWFNNHNGAPRPHAVANQWAGSIGGPIKKDKSFFFIDNEGLYLAIPTSTQVPIPSPAFQAATLASIPASQVPFYQKIFNLYNNAPGVSRAVPTGTPGVDQFRSTAGNHTHEWILTGRYDQIFGNSDRAFIHFRMDRGLQASYTDPLTPLFNVQSNQPQYEGQINWNHTFGSNAVNQLIVAGSYYSAVFTVPNAAAAAAAFPYSLNFAGSQFYPIGGPAPVFTDANQNGRNVTQYQIEDDYSRQIGSHNLKFGVNFVRDDVTDFRLLVFNQFGLQPAESIADFQAGLATLGYTQQFPTNGRISAPLALYNLGFYGEDNWRATSKLTLTIGLRADHFSNPVCQINCFSRFPGSFEGIQHDLNQPYNQAILYNQHQALTNFDKINLGARVGFAYQPFSGIVFRGGAGMFYDRFPGDIADLLLSNPPFNNGFVVGSTPTAPVLLSNAPAVAAASNAAFLSSFASGGTLASISATSPFFAPPSFFNPAGVLHSPQYYEWNLEMQKSIGPNMTFSTNYVGNHGIHETWTNVAPNGFDPNGFGGLPLTAPDQRFSTVQQIESSAISNYNGLTLSLSRRYKSLQLQVNYTWSHALDEISNGGILQFNFLDNQSILYSQNPSNLRQYNYGNSDYDVRHYLSLNYVYTTPHNKSSWLAALGDWTIAGNLFTRSGYPFTVVDSAVSSALVGQNFFPVNPALSFANQVTPGAFSCGSSAATTACPVMLNAYTPITLNAAGSPVGNWGNQRRNQIYGPHYFNTNLTVMKNFKVPGWEKGTLSLGAQFFNILNHPNFDQPVGDIASPFYGTIQSTLNTPTSVYGSFLGADASARQIQLRGTLTF